MRSSLFSPGSWPNRRPVGSILRESRVLLSLLACCCGSYLGFSLPNVLTTANLPGMVPDYGLVGVAVAQTSAQNSSTPMVSPGTPTPISPTPNSTDRPGNNSGSSLNPDFVSNLQVTNYAKAVLEIEQVRVKFHHQATKVLGGALPPNTCMGNDRANVPPRLETICRNYLQESRTIVEKNRLSPAEFNNITQRSRNDVVLMSRIRQELIRWQRVRSAGTRPNGTPIER